MKPDEILGLDPVIHVPTRLAILSLLSATKSASFSYLKNTIGVTDGNLSTHLNKLEEHTYIQITKTFKGKRPLTTCSLTEQGRKAFIGYIQQMEQIIEQQKEI